MGNGPSADMGKEHHRGSLGVAQEAAGGRSGRFRVRSDAQSGPGHPGDRLGKFHFWSKMHHFFMISPWGPGGDGGPW